MRYIKNNDCKNSIPVLRAYISIDTNHYKNRSFAKEKKPEKSNLISSWTFASVFCLFNFVSFTYNCDLSDYFSFSDLL